ncbi:thioredoxin [Candidatus Sumerlaeota bacterium]|nr:thioredoxin [Candidatus Sumerlaeota bacterium]
MASDLVHAFTDDNFDGEVAQSKTPVFVDFWAEWCGPCRMVAPIVEEIAKEFEGRLKVGKVDVDSCPNVAAAHAIQSIPTMLLFVNGEAVESIVGAMPKAQIVSRIQPHIKTG